MSFGKGAVYVASSKQKTNTKSFTYAELFRASDAMPKILGVHRFMEAQGYVIEDAYIYQDNESAILLEENDHKSVGKASRHVKIKYFSITDQIKGKELRVLHCPTGNMIADFFTKPSQDITFVTHRNSILGINSKDFPAYQKLDDNYIKSITDLDTA